MKQTLYLIPGTMCTQAMWQYLDASLTEDYELCHLHIPNDCSLEEIASRLCDLFEEPQVNLIGFSLGGYLASLIACRFPDRVKSLMVIANSPCALAQTEMDQRRISESMLNRFGYKGMARVKAASLLRDKEEPHIDLMLKMDHELGVDTLKSQLVNTSLRQDLMPELMALSCPINLIYSLEDRLINLDWMNALAHKQRPNITFFPFQGDSHMLPFEEVEALLIQIKAFVNP
jgi:pimeloyl-ACP methyl ester carboxylesterase